MIILYPPLALLNLLIKPLDAISFSAFLEFLFANCCF